MNVAYLFAKISFLLFLVMENIALVFLTKVKSLNKKQINVWWSVFHELHVSNKIRTIESEEVSDDAWQPMKTLETDKFLWDVECNISDANWQWEIRKRAIVNSYFLLFCKTLIWF